MILNPQLHPLELDSRTGEPFLRLRNHKNIVITPPRESDVPLYGPNMNDPRIYEWLESPPFPYTAGKIQSFAGALGWADVGLTEHAKDWYAKIKKVTDTALEQLEAAQDLGDLSLVGASPVRVIREIQESGEDVFVGDIGITRLWDGALLVPEGVTADDELEAKYVKENSALALGDPQIIWTFGYYTIPSYHGRGIMTDAVQTLLWDWAVPRMGVRHILASAFEGNEGSLGVFRKNKFVRKRTIAKYSPMRKRWRNLHLLEWKRSDVEPPWDAASLVNRKEL